MVCNPQESLNDWDWARGCTTMGYKHPRPLAELIILPFFQKNSYMGISKIKTVHRQMAQVIPSQKTKETQGKQGCQLEERRRTAQRPQNLLAKKQHRDDWLMTSRTYKNADKSQLWWQRDHEPIHLVMPLLAVAIPDGQNDLHEVQLERQSPPTWDAQLQHNDKCHKSRDKSSKHTYYKRGVHPHACTHLKLRSITEEAITAWSL